jgi:hypothetical protein
MASAQSTSPSPFKNHRPSTLQGPGDHTNVLRLLADRMRDIGLPDMKSVRDFTYWATKEFGEEETRYATETMTSLSKRFSIETSFRKK